MRSSFKNIGVPTHQIMKTILTAILPLLAATLSASAAVEAPTGFLNVSESLVRATGSVMVDWKVEFPAASQVEELVTIDEESDTITANSELQAKVRILGCGYANIYGQYGYLESWTQFSDQRFASNFFNGYGDDVNPNRVMLNERVRAGVDMNFAFRGAVSATRQTPWWNRTFNDWRVMGPGHGGILILKDGDAAPDFSPEQSNQLSARTFLLPYLSQDGSKIQIGARDVVILVDLNKDSAQSGADYQDYVILMSFNDK